MSKLIAVWIVDLNFYTDASGCFVCLLLSN